MISVSEEFKTAAKAQARRISSRVKINFTDLFLDPTATALLDASEFAAEDGQDLLAEDSQQFLLEDNITRDTYEDQVVNGRRGSTQKWASMDGVTLLDGTSFHAPGNSDLASFNEIGWWGNVISDGNGDFPYPQVISIEFSARNITRMDLAADDKRNEYPVNFEYEFFDGVGASLGTYAVTGNGTPFRSDAVEFTAVEQITLTITKWSTPGTNAKITEISSVLEQVFNGDDVESIQVTEQREISNDNSIPTGNIAASESSVALINRNRQFDANNANSPFFNSVRPGSRVRVEIGILKPDGVVEYVPVFSGWSVSWSVPEKALEAVTTARDRLDLLTRTDIVAGAVETNKTFGYWFEKVLNDAGLSSAEYEIDPVLFGDSYIVPYGWLDNQTHREALELLATGCAGAVYQDRLGIIQVQSIVFMKKNGITAVESYTRADYMDKDNQPVYENLANRVLVVTAPRVPAASATIYETAAGEPETIDGNTVETFTIFYEDTPVINGSASITPPVSGVTITDSTYYSWGAELEVTNTNGTGQQFYFAVTGQVLEIKGRQSVTAINQDSIDNNGEYLFSFKENLFLQKKSLAIIIADGLIDSFSDPQRDLTINFTPGGSPAIELVDKISVTDNYETKEYNIISTEMRYDGSLSIQHKARVVDQFDAFCTEDDQPLLAESGVELLVEQLIVLELFETEAGAPMVTQNNEDLASNRISIL
jgi:hypothetical protein